MTVLLALIIVALLVVIPWVAVGVGGMTVVFGVVLPLAAATTFVVGIVWRVVGWARSPVPFRIPTTCGQQKSLDFVHHQPLDNPSTTWGVVGRMLLEVLFFRSLFRNTSTRVDAAAMRVTHSENLLLWVAAMMFHWSMVFIILRHFRFFLRDVPAWVGWLEGADAFFEIGLPEVYVTTVLFLLGGVILLARRLLEPFLRYLSLTQDYVALFLLLGIGVSGALMRHVLRVDVAAVKDSVAGLASLSFAPPVGVGVIYYVHVALVSAVLVYFPFSKLLHAPGVFLSPTRNLANDNRARRHVNPWNPDIVGHTYAEWEHEFHDKIVAAGLPLDKE